MLVIKIAVEWFEFIKEQDNLRFLSVGAETLTVQTDEKTWRRCWWLNWVRTRSEFAWFIFIGSYSLSWLEKFRGYVVHIVADIKGIAFSMKISLTS